MRNLILAYIVEPILKSDPNKGIVNYLRLLIPRSLIFNNGVIND